MAGVGGGRRDHTGLTARPVPHQPPRTALGHGRRRGRLALGHGFITSAEVARRIPGAPSGRVADTEKGEQTMTTIVWINVLLAVPFIALWAGIPLWLVLKRSDPRPQAAAPAIAAAPELHVPAAYRRAA